MLYDVRQSVMDALDACQKIQEITQGLTFETYQQNFRDRLAVERLFEILGEAFNRVDDADPSFRDKCLPEMGDVIGMRNRVIHGYDAVSDEIIWLAVTTRVPPLTDKLAAWLNGTTAK